MCEEKVLLLTPTMKALLFKCTFCFQVHSDSEYYTAEQSGSKYKLKVAKKNQSRAATRYIKELWETSKTLFASLLAFFGLSASASCWTFVCMSCLPAMRNTRESIDKKIVKWFDVISAV